MESLLWNSGLFLLSAGFLLSVLFLLWRNSSWLGASLAGFSRRLYQSRSAVAIRDWSMGTEKKTRFSLFWMSKDDAAGVVALEEEGPGNIHPCRIQDIRSVIKKGRKNAVVVKKDGKEHVAHLFFVVYPERIFLVSLCVARKYQRLGIGSLLLQWILDESPREIRREKVDGFVRESALGSQLFLRENGFCCTAIEKDLFLEPDEDGYFFEYVNVPVSP